MSFLFRSSEKPNIEEDKTSFVKEMTESSSDESFTLVRESSDEKQTESDVTPERIVEECSNSTLKITITNDVVEETEFNINPNKTSECSDDEELIEETEFNTEETESDSNSSDEETESDSNSSTEESEFDDESVNSSSSYSVFDSLINMNNSKDREMYNKIHNKFLSVNKHSKLTELADYQNENVVITELLCKFVLSIRSHRSAEEQDSYIIKNVYTCMMKQNDRISAPQMMNFVSLMKYAMNCLVDVEFPSTREKIVAYYIMLLTINDCNRTIRDFDGKDCVESNVACAITNNFNDETLKYTHEDLIEFLTDNIFRAFFNQPMCSKPTKYMFCDNMILLKTSKDVLFLQNIDTECNHLGEYLDVIQQYIVENNLLDENGYMFTPDKNLKSLLSNSNLVTDKMLVPHINLQLINYFKNSGLSERTGCDKHIIFKEFYKKWTKKGPVKENNYKNILTRVHSSNIVYDNYAYNYDMSTLLVICILMFLNIWVDTSMFMNWIAIHRILFVCGVFRDIPLRTSISLVFTILTANVLLTNFSNYYSEVRNT
jgi:hypothetical protein